jgi:hypothetical protein
MLKLAITSIFIGTTLLGFSTENIPLPEELKSDESRYVYEHIGIGCIHLLEHDYMSALENFSIAESYNSDASELRAELHLWICFGQVIAYDNLDMSDQCKQAVGSLFLSVYDIESEEESIEEEDSSSEVWEFMKQLASLAKSSNVRRLLEELVNDDE